MTIALTVFSVLAVAYALYERRQRIVAESHYSWQKDQGFHLSELVNKLEDKLFVAEQEILGVNENDHYKFNYCDDILKYAALPETEEITHGY